MWRRLAKINIAVGVWLVLAPWVLGYDLAVARVNDMVVGVLVALAALASLAWSPARWGNTALGAWLIIAPFVLGYGLWDASLALTVNARIAALNEVIAGFVVLGVSLAPAVRRWQVRAPSPSGA